MSEGVKPTASFWVVGVVALLWNLMGVAIYWMMVTTPVEDIAGQYGQEFADIFATKPAWATGAFAIAVFGGLLGCIALLLRKSWARILFVISLIGVIVHNVWGVMAGTLDHVGTSDHIMTVVVMLISVFLIWFSSRMTSNGVLR